MQNTKQAVFKLGSEEFGLDIIDVNTIEQPISLDTVSGITSNVKGILHLRGDHIPVYSLRRKFGMEDKEPDEETRYVIVTSSGINIAYEVDEIQDIVLLDSDQLYEVPTIVKCEDTSYLKSIAKIDGRMILLLDRDHILSSQEQEQINTTIY